MTPEAAALFLRSQAEAILAAGEHVALTLSVRPLEVAPGETRAKLTNAEKCRRARARRSLRDTAPVSETDTQSVSPVSPHALSSSSGSLFSSSPDLNSEPLFPAFSSSPDLTQSSQVSTQAGETPVATPTPTQGATPVSPAPLAIVPPTPKSKPAKAPKTRRCPETWQPKDGHWKIADERGIDLRFELAKFRDYEFARPWSDWDACFRNWLRNARPAAASREPFLSEREKLERRLMAAASAGATAEGKTASIFGSLFTPAKDAAE